MDKKEAEQIKKELLKQLEKSPNQNKEQIAESIKSMSESQLEDFLKQNNIQYKTTEKGKPVQQECVFCSILKGKIPAYIIDENAKSLAILEINPLSKGHTIVISKKHNKLYSSSLSLANKIAKKIKSKLKADEVKIESGNILGHEIVNVIPMYKGRKLKAEKASEKDLILLQDKLKKQQRKPRKKTTKKKTKKLGLPQAPVRIP